MLVKILLAAIVIFIATHQYIANGQLYETLVCNGTCTCKSNSDDNSTWKIDCEKSPLNHTRIAPVNDTLKYTEITFENSQLTTLVKDPLSKFHASHVESYNFANNKISDIEKHAFDMLTNLKNLNLRKNKLTTIDNDWFEGLSIELETLDLSYNRIRDIPEGAFKNLNNLKYLNLDGNLIAEVTDKTFSGLSFVREISLDFTLLPKLSDNAFTADTTPMLETLSIRKSSLGKLPILKNLKYLKKVEFDQNELIDTVFKDTFKGVPSVEDVSLDDMERLKTIEDCAFCGLTKLKFIRISDSPRLNTIPNSAFDVGFSYEPSLQMVDFSNNSLTTLSSKMFPWKSVSSIYLMGNKWNCTCEMVWLTEISNVIKDYPQCSTPESLQQTPLSTLNATAFTACRRPTYRTPKIFIAMTIMLLLSGIILITWYIFTARKQDGGIGHLFKSNPLVKQPYAYRNLAMHQEDGEQIVSNRSAEPDDEDDAPYPPFDKDHGNKASLV